MTGPEHFAEGERLLAEAAKRYNAAVASIYGEVRPSDPTVRLLTERATAHFAAARTAALAAALHPGSVSWRTALGLLDRKEEDR